MLKTSRVHNSTGLSLILNFMVIGFSLLHHTGLHNVILGQITGILILVVMFFNLSLIAADDKYRFGVSAAICFLSTIYIVLVSAGIFSLIVMQGDYVLPLLAYPVYYALFAIPVVLSLHNLKNVNRTTAAPSAGNFKLKRFLKIALSIFCILSLFIFSIISFVILTGGLPGQGLWWAIGSMAAGLGGLAIFSIPGSIILLIKVNAEILNRISRLSIAAYGIILTVVCSLPFLAVPVTIEDADRQFAASFGPGWNAFENEVKAAFLKPPFVLGDYYLGMVEPDTASYNVKHDLLFHQEQDYELKYDVYYPEENSKNPGIIFIHGGGFIMGDKGENNLILKNLASRGYVIFDIQYRLLDANFFDIFIGIDIELDTEMRAPGERLSGAWIVDDMIDDVAAFTRYLANNNDYGADLDNIYFMGLSAGGYLGAISTLAYHSGHWDFSPEINISGGIFFFPADDFRYFYEEMPSIYEGLREAGFFPGNKTPAEDPELYDRLAPGKQVDPGDPPCLLIHGTNDQLTFYEFSEGIQKAMLDSGNTCILLKGFFGGHGHTVAVHYQSVALYYIERFLYLTH